MAQLVAHLHGMQGVRGSSPLRSTKMKKGVPQGALFFIYEILSVWRASAFGPRHTSTATTATRMPVVTAKGSGMSGSKRRDVLALLQRRNDGVRRCQ